MSQYHACRIDFGARSVVTIKGLSIETGFPNKTMLLSLTLKVTLCCHQARNALLFALCLMLEGGHPKDICAANLRIPAH
jgi:hypothetical protein